MELLQWGCSDPAQMSWLDQPPVVNLLAAKRLLQMLGALEGERLSAQGQKMAALGNDPRLAAMLVSAKNDDEAATAAKIAAILEEPPRMGNSDLGVAFSRNQPAWQQRSQQLLKRLNVRGGEADSSLIAPLLAGAFADRIARRRGQDGRYQLANGMGAMLDANDALSRHEWLIAPLLLQGSASPDARILLALLVDIDELVQRCPQLVQQSDTVEWDDAQGTLKAWRRLQIGQLTVKVQPLAKPSEDELHQAMLNGIRDKGLSVLNWTAEAEQLRLRLLCAAKWLPEYDWPAVDDESLLAALETWLLPHMTGVHSLRGLKSLDIYQALRGLLDWGMQQRLDSELPAHYTVPTGSRIAIRYHEDNPPALAVRMQEMFGEATNPTIAQGRVPLVLELLSPAQRPLQITRDLSDFWKGAYREVQRDERALSQTCLAGRPGKYCTDATDEKVFVRLVFSLSLWERAGVRASARTFTLTLTLSLKGEGTDSSTNFERYLLLSCNRRTENRAFAPEYCGEKAWPGMTASQLDAKGNRRVRSNKR